MTRRLALAAVLTACLSSSVHARADEPSSDAAQALFREGRVASDRGDWETACARFAESLALDRAVGTLFNLAHCEEQRGLVASAWRHYQDVIDALPSTDERLPIAKKRLVDLEPRLPRLTIRLAPGAPADVRITRDGADVALASMGVAVPVDPGEHAVVVTSRGHAERRFVVASKEGEASAIDVEPGPPLPGAPAPPPAPPASGDARRTAGYVVGAAGVAGLAVGVVTGLLVLSKKSVVNDHCDRDMVCDREGYDAARAGATLGTLSTIGFVAGGISIAMGTVLVVTAPPPGASSGRAATTSIGVVREF